MLGFVVIAANHLCSPDGLGLFDFVVGVIANRGDRGIGCERLALHVALDDDGTPYLDVSVDFKVAVDGELAKDLDFVPGLLAQTLP